MNEDYNDGNEADLMTKEYQNEAWASSMRVAFDFNHMMADYAADAARTCASSPTPWRAASLARCRIPSPSCPTRRDGC